MTDPANIIEHMFDLGVGEVGTSAKERLLKARLALQSAQNRNNVQPFEIRGISGRPVGLRSLEGNPKRIVEQVVPLFADNSWVAMVNVPHIGWEGAKSAGWILERTAVITCDEDKGKRVISLLLEGLDIVVIGNLSLSAQEQSRLAAKARQLDRLIFKCTPWKVTSGLTQGREKGHQLDVG